jgi:hypothetical protein
MTIVAKATGRDDHRISVEPGSTVGGKRTTVNLLVQNGERTAKITLNKTEAEGLIAAVKAALR